MRIRRLLVIILALALLVGVGTALAGPGARPACWTDGGWQVAPVTGVGWNSQDEFIVVGECFTGTYGSNGAPDTYRYRLVVPASELSDVTRAVVRAYLER